MATLVLQTTGVRDAWIDQASQATNNGTSSSVQAHFQTANATERRSLVGFDTSGLPIGAIITAVDVDLWVSGTTTSPRTYLWHRLYNANHDWVEGEVCWDVRKTGIPWASNVEGCITPVRDYDSASLGTFTYNAPAGVGEAVGTLKTASLTLTREMIFDILDGELNLVLVRTTSGSGLNPTFRSTNSSTSGERPRLTITYTQGTVYYVATNGNDSRTTTQAQVISTPWATLTHALQQLVAGDTLVARGGDYVEDPWIAEGDTASGTASDWITVRNYPGEIVWLKGPLKMTACHYWQFIGINCDFTDVPYINGAAYEDLFFMRNANNWMIRKCIMKSKETPNTNPIGSTGGAKTFVAGDGDDWLIEDCIFHDNPGLRPDVTPQVGDVNTNAIYQDHTIYNSSGDGGTVRRTWLYNVPNGRAVKLGTSSSGLADPLNATIHEVTMHDTMGPTPVRVSYGSDGNIIEGSFIGGPAHGDGNGSGIVTTHNPDDASTMLTITNSYGWKGFDDTTNGGDTLVSASQTNIIDGGGNTYTQSATGPALNDVGEPTTTDTWSGGADHSGIILYGHLRGLTGDDQWDGPIARFATETATPVIINHLREQGIA